MNNTNLWLGSQSTSWEQYSKVSRAQKVRIAAGATFTGRRCPDTERVPARARRRKMGSVA